ncbi:MAG: protein-disulfide isomerase [Sphingomonas bacterium]|uniref:thioredoxin domain-containing protein n=1 Tax=Sphingomonas bacterium TaxID=1895847 RepID=UPI0026398E9A|nr:thioredoxin domain-containing protein [Sphingomonas bacterium]MDB5706943.1 protein-disulfide isomerase [Sphingomonas bacterium]
MKFRIACAILPVLFVAACGKGGTDANSNAPAAAPVAAVTAPAGQNWVDTVVKTPEGGFRMGNPNAAVKLIEYGSRTCPHCAVFDKEGFPVLKSGPIASGKLSYEFRDYPIHNELDIGPILLGHCVEPAQFFPMLDQMMSSQETLVYRKDKIPDADQERLKNASPPEIAAYLANFYGYFDFVKQRGVPDAKARACLADPKGLETIARNTDAANQQYKVQGTPTFIVNGDVVQNAAEWSQLEPALKAAGAL